MVILSVFADQYLTTYSTLLKNKFLRAIKGIFKKDAV